MYASPPTGYGKSLIFFAAPVFFDEILKHPRGSSKILVISPLKRLMEGQVAYLKSLGLSAIALHSQNKWEKEPSHTCSLHQKKCCVWKDGESFSSVNIIVSF